MWCQGNFDSRVGCLMIRGSSRHLFSSCLLLQGRSSILLLVKKTGRAAAKSSSFSACVLRRFVFLLFSARAGPISVLTHALISAAVVRSCRSGAVPESVLSLVRRPCSIFSSAALEQFRSPALISRRVDSSSRLPSTHSCLAPVGLLPRAGDCSALLFGVSAGKQVLCSQFSLC
jgi:hypothetical protein